MVWGRRGFPVTAPTGHFFRQTPQPRHFIRLMVTVLRGVFTFSFGVVLLIDYCPYSLLVNVLEECFHCVCKVSGYCVLVAVAYQFAVFALGADKAHFKKY